MTHPLKMSFFTLQKRQTLSAAIKQKRLERSKVLLKEFRSGMAGAIVWSDEKIFTVKSIHNRRNDRIIERNVKEIPYNQKTVCVLDNEISLCHGLGHCFKNLEVSPHFLLIKAQKLMLNSMLNTSWSQC